MTTAITIALAFIVSAPFGVVISWFALVALGTDDKELVVVIRWFDTRLSRPTTFSAPMAARKAHPNVFRNRKGTHRP